MKSHVAALDRHGRIGLLYPPVWRCGLPAWISLYHLEITRALRMRWLRRVLRGLSDLCLDGRRSQRTPNPQRDPEACRLAGDTAVGLSTPPPTFSRSLLFSRCGSALHDLRDAAGGLPRIRRGKRALSARRAMKRLPPLSPIDLASGKPSGSDDPEASGGDAAGLTGSGGDAAVV